MFGAVIRAAAIFGPVALLATGLAVVLGVMTPYMRPPGSTDPTMLSTSFYSLGEWFIFIALVALLAGLVAAAVVEGKGGF